MNDVIDSILNHRSIRNYLNKPIEDEKLDAILQCAQAAPSSINGQQMSIIVIKDQQTKDQIAELTGGQKWISETPVFLVFVADFYRAKIACDKYDKELVITNNMEGTLVGSIDVGLAMGNTIAAAESLGLGTVCIGAVRRDPAKMIELLNLPEYVYPMVGLCVGYFDTDTAPAKKPRFDKEAVIHTETYNHDLFELVNSYDETIKNYMAERTNGKEVHDWSSHIANFYTQVYFPLVSGTIRDQKFLCE